MKKSTKDGFESNEDIEQLISAMVKQVRGMGKLDMDMDAYYGYTYGKKSQPSTCCDATAAMLRISSSGCDDLSPERSLFVSIIYRAIKDLYTRDFYIRLNAKRWIFSPANNFGEGGWSFLYLCDALEINPDNIKNRCCEIAELIEREAKERKVEQDD